MGRFERNMVLERVWSMCFCKWCRKCDCTNVRTRLNVLVLYTQNLTYVYVHTFVYFISHTQKAEDIAFRSFAVKSSMFGGVGHYYVKFSAAML